MTLVGLPSLRCFRISISQSIVLGFLLLLLISLVVTGFLFSGLNQYSQHFSKFQETSISTNMMLKFNKDVSEFQRQILVFSNTEKNTSTAQLILLHQQLLDDIDALIVNDVTDQNSKSSLLNQINNAIKGLVEKIESLESQRSYRESMISINLAELYQQIDKEIEELFIQAGKKDNILFIKEIWLTENYLNNAKQLSDLYFRKHDVQLKKNVLEGIQMTEQSFRRLLLSQSWQAEPIQTILTLIEKTKIVFNQSVQADRNYLFLINVVLAGETAEISNLSDELRKIYLDEQQQLIANTEQHIRFIKNISIISSIIGALLATLIAFFIISRIRKPLISITHTFSRLAEGDNTQEIPGTERSDEIGKLAQAANVFRQTNVRTQELLIQAEEFTVQLKQREIELELAVKKAESANLSKSQFLANMSHELRTPMNAILGMLSLLQKTELNARQSDYAIKSEGAAKSLLSLLNDILDLSKAESGKMELDPIAFNLEVLLGDLSVILSTNIANKPVELLLNINNDVPRYLLGDSLRLQQILINLGGNAIKFTNRGHVVISVSATRVSSEVAHLTFSIKDSGIGIAAENQQKIFGGFTQAEASTTRKFGGTGLGLAISQRLVTLMGGKLSVQSEVGVGSEFIFSIQLPILSSEQVLELNKFAAKNHALSKEKQLAAIKILLVEDNLTNQQIALELLESEGALVRVANNGLEAIDFLSLHLKTHQTPGVDLVLMDLQMPIMDGLRATEKIRQELNLKDLPIIAMTANAMKSDRDMCLKVGMNEHIGKPFEIQHVLKILRAQVERPELKSMECYEKSETPKNTQEQIALHNKIDMAEAVTRMGGLQSLYIKMIPKFLEQLSALPKKLQDLLASNDISAVANELHSLKGVSVTMGAMQLSEAIAAIEKALENSPQHLAAVEMIQNACHLIQNNIDSVKVLMEDLEQKK